MPKGYDLVNITPLKWNFIIGGNISDCQSESGEAAQQRGRVVIKEQHKRPYGDGTLLYLDSGDRHMNLHR